MQFNLIALKQSSRVPRVAPEYVSSVAHYRVDGVDTNQNSDSLKFNRTF